MVCNQQRPITAEDLYKVPGSFLTPHRSRRKIDRPFRSKSEKKTEKKYSNLWMVSTEPGGRPQQ